MHWNQCAAPYADCHLSSGNRLKVVLLMSPNTIDIRKEEALCTNTADYLNMHKSSVRACEFNENHLLKKRCMLFTDHTILANYSNLGFSLLVIRF